MVVNCALPLDDRFTEVNVWLYKVKEKGSDIVVTQSSQWLPMSVVPGTIVPVIWLMKIWQGDTVGVAVAVGVAVGVGLELAVGVGVGVNVALVVGVGVAVCGIDGVGDAVGVGVPVGTKAHPPVAGPPEPLQKY